MNVKINFDALTTKGEIVANITFTIGPVYPELHPITKNTASLQRLCVEYARTIGVKCSFAEIYMMETTC